MPSNTIAIVGDFTNDGIDDVIWYGPGKTKDRFWIGQTNQSWAGRPLAINGTFEPLTGDFNGDGLLDIFWYAAGKNKDFLWLGNGNATFRSYPQTVNGTYSPVISDFDSDGRTDILWYAPGRGGDAMWYGGSGSHFTSQAMRINGTYDFITGGDFQGDGDLDLLFWNQNASAHPLLHNRGHDAGGSSRSYASSTMTGPGTNSLPMVMNIDGDSADDILWYGYGSAPDSIQTSSGGSVATTVNGSYAPLWSNFNGDNGGYDDIFWWATAPGGSDAFWAADGSGPFQSISMANVAHFDFDTHNPLLGSFDGNGTWDIIFQDSVPGGSNAFFYGNDIDGPGPKLAKRTTSAHTGAYRVRGRVCGSTPVLALKSRCALG